MLANTRKQIAEEIMKESGTRPHKIMEFTFFDCPNCQIQLAYKADRVALHCNKCGFDYSTLSPHREYKDAEHIKDKGFYNG